MLAETAQGGILIAIDEDAWFVVFRWMFSWHHEDTMLGIFGATAGAVRRARALSGSPACSGRRVNGTSLSIFISGLRQDAGPQETRPLAAGAVLLMSGDRLSAAREFGHPSQRLPRPPVRGGRALAGMKSRRKIKPGAGRTAADRDTTSSDQHRSGSRVSKTTVQDLGYRRKSYRRSRSARGRSSN